jgi:arabinose-5-phosphate isomerase
MGKNPKTIGAQVYAEEALAVLRQHAIDQVIVIDENRKPIGLVDIQDLL